MIQDFAAVWRNSRIRSLRWCFLFWRFPWRALSPFLADMLPQAYQVRTL